MAQYYNVRKKTFADGTEQYMFYSKAKMRDYEEENRPQEDKEEGGESPDKERSQEVSRKRAVQMVYDIAKSNVWDWFITLTFDPKIVDSYDYDECVKAISAFTHSLRDKSKGFVYLLVPELHEKGRYHFHGLIKGPLPHEKAHHYWTGESMLDDNGHQVYNIPIFKYGHTTAIKCYSQAATGYVAKYITKQDAVPEGKKRYWASRNAARPKLEYLELDMEEYCRIFNASDYQKKTESQWGTFELLEIHGKEEVDEHTTK